MTLLLREAIGGSLRRARTSRRRTLREVSRQARVSLGYLSEVERGRKEASSELLAAICEALEYPLFELLSEVADIMRSRAAQAAVQPVKPLVPIGTRQAETQRAASTQSGEGAPASVTALVRAAA